MSRGTVLAGLLVLAAGAGGCQPDGRRYVPQPLRDGNFASALYLRNPRDIGLYPVDLTTSLEPNGIPVPSRTLLVSNHFTKLRVSQGTGDDRQNFQALVGTVGPLENVARTRVTNSMATIWIGSGWIFVTGVRPRGETDWIDVSSKSTEFFIQVRDNTHYVANLSTVASNAILDVSRKSAPPGTPPWKVPPRQYIEIPLAGAPAQGAVDPNNLLDGNLVIWLRNAGLWNE